MLHGLLHGACELLHALSGVAFTVFPEGQAFSGLRERIVTVLDDAAASLHCAAMMRASVLAVACWWFSALHQMAQAPGGYLAG